MAAWGPRLREYMVVTWGALAYWLHPRPRLVQLLRPDSTAGPPKLLACLDPRDVLPVGSLRHTLAGIWPPDDHCLLVLVRYRRPPLLASRTDAAVRSWAASPALAARLPAAGTPLFDVLDAALRLPDVTVRVVQVGQSVVPRLPAAALAPAVAWIIPHRGAVPWLAGCLHRLERQLLPPDEALVCFDEPLTPPLVALPTAFPRVAFSTLPRPGVGPFVARQRLVERTTCPLVLFQDSDDVPTADRRAVLTAALQARQLDAVGSHELRLDYLQRQVRAVRFPLDASAALRVAMGHPALFPTLLVRRASLLAVGGFSTHLRFALDTQLLLRASFNWRLGNVDAFLYVRRRRAGSLTTDPATALGSPAREQHRTQWKVDFAAVKAGDLRLTASSLAVRRGTEYAENPLCPVLAGRPSISASEVKA